MSDWIEKTPEFVGSRYDRLAAIYPVFEWLYGLPLVGVRRKTVAALRLRAGDRVLELGCGTGLNFPRIEEKIGPCGALYGVDVSSDMLARAEARVRRRGWSNVHLTRGDAGSHAPAAPIDAALFCFSYSTMRDRLDLLARAWRLLEPGGRLVITDAQLAAGWPRRFLLRLGVWMSDRSLLGKPDTDPAQDLARLAGPVSEERISFRLFGWDYVICAATKQSDLG